MLVKLGDQLALMVLVDVGNLLALKLVIILTLDPTEGYFTSVGEPDSLVFVLDELALHAQDLNVVQLCHEICHFVALLQAVLVLIVLNQVDIVANFAVSILDQRSWIFPVHWGVEHYNDGLTDAKFRFNARLHAGDVHGAAGTFVSVIKHLPKECVEEDFIIAPNIFALSFLHVIFSHDHCRSIVQVGEVGVLLANLRAVLNVSIRPSGVRGHTSSPFHVVRRVSSSASGHTSRAALDPHEGAWQDRCLVI